MDFAFVLSNIMDGKIPTLVSSLQNHTEQLLLLFINCKLDRKSAPKSALGESKAVPAQGARPARPDLLALRKPARHKAQGETRRAARSPSSDAGGI